MRNFSENNITEAVLERIGHAENPRIRQISGAVVRHLHALVKELQPTQEEWELAIEFLTAIGHKCDDKRQEFILLSDTLGISMLVDAINYRQAGVSTETTVLGPFYVQDPKEYPLGADVSEGIEGEPLYVEGTASSSNGEPLAGALVDIWHADGDGYYDIQHLEDLDGLAMRARFRTDAEGRFNFWSVMPAAYPIPDDGPVGDMLRAQGRHPYRPAHVHFMIQAPGHEKLVTHVFVENDEYLDSDVVFGVKDSLIAPFHQHPSGAAPDGRSVESSYRRLAYDFVISSLA